MYLTWKVTYIRLPTIPGQILDTYSLCRSLCHTHSTMIINYWKIRSSRWYIVLVRVRVHVHAATKEPKTAQQYRISSNSVPKSK